MATIALVYGPSENKTRTATWQTLQNGDDGAPLTPGHHITHYPDKTLHVIATWGAGGTLAIEGSNDGVNYGVLHDPQGNDLSLDNTGGTVQVLAIAENPLYIRPRITGGDGSTDVDVIISMNRTH